MTMNFEWLNGPQWLNDSTNDWTQSFMIQIHDSDSLFIDDDDNDDDNWLDRLNDDNYNDS